MEIFYGNSNTYINVTNICYTYLKNDNTINIPSGDINRAKIFTDPISHVVKKVFISYNKSLTEYDEFCTIKINTLDNSIVVIKSNDINDTLLSIHSNLKFNYGTLNEEVPEQKMVVRYLTGNEKVLEIGANIGRNTLVIASILKNDKNLVTMECDENSVSKLVENRNLNNYNFYIENSALSKRKLIQRGWDTIPSDTLLDSYNWVNTITLDELKDKYNVQFDTLVLDCEGAFYYILMDMPEILDNINLIIMENDYYNINHKFYIDKVLIKNNFYRDYVEGGGWGECKEYFFEVWKKSQKN